MPELGAFCPGPCVNGMRGRSHSERARPYFLRVNR